MPIGEFLAKSAFDPETTAALASAFDTAWETVKRSGSPLASDANAQSSRERLAKYIIAAAQDGERDLNRLVEGAVSHLAQQKGRSPAGTGGSSS
jgi:hypothetical protein